MNSLIAEFMGISKTYDIIDANDNVLRRNLSKKQAEFLALTFKGYKDENKNSIIPKVVLWNSLTYHTDWNELHKVLLEIERRCEGVPHQLMEMSLFSERSEVYNAVVEFMRIYNPLKKL